MILNSYNNILVLAPHTDDGELGLGGTISKLIELGKKVTYVAFSTAQQSVPEGFPKDILKTEVKKATAQLGILEELIRLKKTNSFDLVFIPSLHDIHQDHTTIAQEGLRAFKNTTLLGYELIWNNLTFNTQCFVELNKEHIQAKVEALKAYESQGTRDYLSEEFIFSLAKTRGVQAGCPYAEAFEVIRLFL